RSCRDRIVVATKGGHPDFETKASGVTRETVLRHVRESLDHLRTDYIDLYWLHRDDRSIPVGEILGWLAEPVAQGLIRAVGCSHWRTDRLAQALSIARRSNLPLVRASQIAWSLARAKVARSEGPYGEQLAMDDDTHAFHVESGLAVAAYNSQAGGFFAAKYDDIDPTSPDFPNPGLAARFADKLNVRRRRLARRMATEKGCSTNQVALAWLLHQPFPTFAIVGPRTMEQLEDSMGAARVSLDNGEVERLRRGDESG
ncbi:MAG: aldo/keto reductase, partial [Chitinivibrionales bacterium]|nr:aldo/keto reductase [Chitinivibrionales bacterium]